MERMLALLRARRFELGALFSHRMPLAEAPRGYELFDQKRERCTKVLLRP
jgi:threonine dehydrogenase-like Zn-dependent dehydrogenase